MRKGFTLIELLVVVVVIVTLMAITFRLGGAGSDSTAKARTINRMQRLENCLSGYYAAYGSYPPVGLHGSRDYRYMVNDLGIQYDADSRGGAQIDEYLELKDKGEEGRECWKRVEAACRSQPVGMSHPFCTRGMRDYVSKVSEILKQKAESKEKRYEAFHNNPALKEPFSALIDTTEISSSKSATKWTRAQIFRYGLLSYLLPRLLVVCMADGGGTNYSDFETIYEEYSQWGSFNELPCMLKSGQPYEDWRAVFAELKSRNARWKIAALPSQATCARWMPNLEGIVKGGGTYYGISTADDWFGSSIVTTETTDPRIYSSEGGGQHYMLDEKTVLDGWGHEFYYYSPAPHQSYTLWSAGPNGRTFPPWVNVDTDVKSEEEKRVAQQWMADDIMHMQN